MRKNSFLVNPFPQPITYTCPFSFLLTKRWRPCQEGAAWLASVATRRKVRFSPVAMRALLEHQMLPASVLLELEAAGHATGITEELLAPHEPAADVAAPTTWTEAGEPTGSTASLPSPSSLRAGGLLVGLLSGAPGCPGLPAGLVEPSEEEGGECNSAAPAAWCWVACVASTKALHVYADANSLHPLRSLLGNGSNGNGNDSSETSSQVETVLAAYQHGDAINNEDHSDVRAKTQRMASVDE